MSSKSNSMAIHTPIAIKSGHTIPIDSLYMDNVMVKSYDISKKQIVDTGLMTFGYEGSHQKCVKLQFENHSTLSCSPYSMIMTLRHGKLEWLPITDIELFNTDIVTTAQLPKFELTNRDLILQDKWALKTSSYGFNIQNNINLKKTMAFARLVGFVTFNPIIVDEQGNHVCIVKPWNDMTQLLDDIKLVRGSIPLMFSVPGIDDRQMILIDDELYYAIKSLDGFKVSNVLTNEFGIPAFLFNASFGDKAVDIQSCPPLIIKEYIGGLFGGFDDSDITDWHNMDLNHMGISNKFKPIIEIISNNPRELYRLQALMTILNIKTCILTNNLNQYIKVSLSVDNNNIIEFIETIGYRYCQYKQFVMSMWNSWKHVTMNIQHMNHVLVGEIAAATNFKELFDKSCGCDNLNAKPDDMNELMQTVKTEYVKRISDIQVYLPYIVRYDDLVVHMLNLPNVDTYNKPSFKQWLTGINYDPGNQVYSMKVFNIEPVDKCDQYSLTIDSGCDCEIDEIDEINDIDCEHVGKGSYIAGNVVIRDN